MKRYKLPGGGLHSVPDDGSQDVTITVDMVRISEAQYLAMLAVVPDAPSTEAQRLVQDTAAARQHAKLQALVSMTPAQVQAWVAANVNTLADVKNALATLAIGMSILGRKL